ncbi:peptidyl-prolyl cis-trans isomerase FKBP2-like protein [Sarotherodon galilaeus]
MVKQSKLLNLMKTVSVNATWSDLGTFHLSSEKLLQFFFRTEEASRMRGRAPVDIRELAQLYVASKSLGFSDQSI